MPDPDETVAWYANAVSWSLVCGLVLACCVLGMTLGFEVPLARAVLPALGVASLGGAWLIGRARNDARLVAGAVAFLQMTLFTIAGVVLTFLLAAQAQPLWDARLSAADARLGLSWPMILAAADRMPAALLLLCGLAYHSLVAQMVLCIVLLAATGHLERLRVAVSVAILCGTVTVLASGLMPAAGNVFDPGHYQRLWPSVAWADSDLVAQLRDGSLRQIDLSHMTGIVSFPSYHAALPVILCWALHPLRRLRRVAQLWAALTIAATPLFGGHYLVDVLAGLLLAAATLALTRWRDAAARMRNAGRCDTRTRFATGLPALRGSGRAGVRNDVV